MELFSYQQKFLKVIQESFKEQIYESLAKILMVLATGLGKTIVAAFWAKNELALNPKQKILFLCHENNILNQTFDYFLKIIDGQTIMKKFYGQGETKDFLADNAQIVFGSFQTFSNWRYAFDADHFDILIVDESHHSQAETYKEVIEYFQAKKRFGMTATPDRMDLKDIRELFGAEIISCDLIEAILNNWLTPFEYHVLNDHISTRKLKKILGEVLKRRERISVKQLNETIFIEKRDEEIVKRISEFNNNFQKKTIIFCENIDHIREFIKSLPEGLEFHSLNNSENEENLQMFRDGEVKTILAVNKFNEGIDVPDVEVIVFLRGTDSSTIFFQQLGRGLRKIPGKEKVIILDFVANVDRLLMVSSLIERIREKSGIIVSKRIFKVGGDNFDYVFEDKKLGNILEVIKCILAKTYISDIPRLVEEYSEKNELPANQVIAGTNKKLWWKCKTCGHEWAASGNSRVSGGHGCPACANKVVTEKNNLAITHPHLAEEYSDRNKLPADKVIAGTNKKLWWKCKTCGHEWSKPGNDRVGGKGCPSCSHKVATDKNNLTVTHPHLAEEYSERNELPADQIIAGTDKKLWWKCKTCGYEWKAKGNRRVNGVNGCVVCRSLLTLYPHIAEEYSKRNELPADQITAGTSKKLWWKCKTCGHEWKAKGSDRVSNETGCPACANQVITDKNNLTVTHPYLAKEYSERNKLPADQITAGTNKKLWWKCRTCGHEWQAVGSNRVRGAGCPACANKVVTEKNNLTVTHPCLAEEYSERNEFPADQVYARTHKRLWWKCKTCGHEWQASGKNRASGQGCHNYRKHPKNN